MSTSVKTKIQEVLNSANFHISLVGIITTALAANGIVLENSPEELYNIFNGAKGEQLIIAVIMYAVLPLSKAVSKFLSKEWSWKIIIKSGNFRTMVSSALLLLVGAVVGEELASIIVTFIINLLNSGIHIMKPPKNGSEPVLATND